MLLALAALAWMTPMRLVDLTTEYLHAPLNVGSAQPRFAWKGVDETPGATQTAYQVVVTSDGKTLWDSGKSSGRSNSQITYKGEPLKSLQYCQWKVRVWNQEDQPTKWFTSHFRMGLLLQSDWKGQWVGSPKEAPEIHAPHNGYHCVMERSSNVEKWVMIDLGSRQAFDSVVLYPTQPFDHQPPTPGFLFPLRFAIEYSDSPDFQSNTRFIDQTAEDFVNPKNGKVEFNVNGVTGRYVRLRVIKLAERNEGYFGFALAEMQIRKGGTVISKGAQVTAKDSVENSSWGTKRLVDGEITSHPLQGLDSLPCTELSKSFQTNQKVKSAFLHATAMGSYIPYLNGKQVGDYILAPEWTDYHTRIQTQTYEVTQLMKPGQNELNVLLGDGWYAGRIGMAQGLDPRGYPRGVYGRKTWFLGQIEINYEDGTTVFVSTDSTWLSGTDGPVRTSDIYDGESVDLTRKAFDRRSMIPVATMPISDEAPLLQGQPNEPIRIVETLKPESISEPKPGIFVVDFGQNMVGRLRADLVAESGSQVEIQYAEMLNDDGTVYVTNLRGAPQRDHIKMPKSGEVKDWTTHFTYHGFRYVQLKGLSKKPKSTQLHGEVFCSSSPEIASFETSDPMVNRLWKNIFWTQRANLMSVPTDCPQRDERLGWMGDILAFSQNSFYNMDMSGFFTKWLVDVRDAQSDDGKYPDFAPHPYGKNDRFTGVPGWGDAGVVCAWVHYRNTGDTRLLSEHFDSMAKWVDWIASKNPDFLWKNERHNDYGDWLNGNTLIRDGWNSTGGEVPKEVFATMMWYQSVCMVRDSANVLGRPEVRKYSEVAKSIWDSFNRAYVQPNGQILGDCQAGYALALYYGLVPKDLEPKVFQNLVRKIEERGGVLTTGFHSTLPMMEMLTKFHRNDLAYKLLLNKEFPSWGYTIANGATTIWERWDGYVQGRGFQDPGMNSFNHWALGSVGQWMMETVGGIRPMDPGWASALISPEPGPGISWSKASYNSPKGKISVSWNSKDDAFTVKVVIPPSMTALIKNPFGYEVKKILKGQLQMKGNFESYLVDSGQYEIEYRKKTG